MSNVVGYIYILTNPSIPDYVKIGYAENVDKRIRGLNNKTALPFSFRVYATYGVSIPYTDKQIHSIIDQLNPDLRAVEVRDGKSRRREFFAMEPETAYKILHAIAEIHGDSDRLKRSEQTDDDRETEVNNDNSVGAKKKAEAFRFSLANIPVGSTIAFIRDPSKTAEVISDKLVRYEGETCSLSYLASLLTGKERALQGPIYFTYNGETLDNLRKKAAEADEE